MSVKAASQSLSHQYLQQPCKVGQQLYNAGGLPEDSIQNGLPRGKVSLKTVGLIFSVNRRGIEL